MTTPPEALREMGEIFDEAANHLECAMLALGSALEKRIKNLDETIADDEAALTHHKEAARFLHGRIAGFRAERARIAAQTGLDLLRAVVAEPRAEVEKMADAAERQTSADKGPHCKGSWALGNNCRTCWRCLETKPQAAAQAPALLDLRSVGQLLGLSSSATPAEIKQRAAEVREILRSRTSVKAEVSNAVGHRCAAITCTAAASWRIYDTNEQRPDVADTLACDAHLAVLIGSVDPVRPLGPWLIYPEEPARVVEEPK